MRGRGCCVCCVVLQSMDIISTTDSHRLNKGELPIIFRQQNWIYLWVSSSLLVYFMTHTHWPSLLPSLIDDFCFGDFAVEQTGSLPVKQRATTQEFNALVCTLPSLRFVQYLCQSPITPKPKATLPWTVLVSFKCNLQCFVSQSSWIDPPVSKNC